ncbi:MULTISPECIES: hypothetical protein [Actinomycetes]|uniref:hypothetical protein n=1 Tax=Actinomycetes TaxID=1760 RepID=UPI0016427ADE|nr:MULTISPECIES: hypothetical protein [Actinomycetes]MDA4829674.1 hypothetical protein [Kocuria rhizophila]
MSVSRTALFVGLILGLVAAFGTIGDFLLVVLFGVIGLIVGRILEGKLDVGQLFGRAKR